MLDIEPNNISELHAPGPGERLRAARLARDIELDRIAKQLHLTARLVEALERNDYSEIQTRVFARGYLRNYARLVDLPAESILQQFDSQWPEDGTHKIHVKDAPKLPADVRPGRGWVTLMTWGMLLGVITLFLMWWRGYLDHLVIPPQGGQDSLEIQEPTLFPSPGLSLPAAKNPLSSGERSTARESTAPDSSEIAPFEQVKVPEVVAEVVEPVADMVQSEPVGAGVNALALPMPTVARPAVAVATPMPAPVVAASATPAAVDTAGVVMQFTAPCWVDVRDSTRKFKLFGEMTKGSERRLEGSPPYQVVLGNASAVRILINGKLFDLAAHTNGNVARFTLEP